MIDREKTLNNKQSFEMIQHKPEIALQRVELIDENGEIQSKVQEVVIDESEMIAKTPAYTTKIEYIQKYGTLDKNNVLKLTKSNPSFNNMDVQAITRLILEHDKNK